MAERIVGGLSKSFDISGSFSKEGIRKDSSN